MLSDTQIERYSRQILLPELGGRKQEALLDASVALLGGGRCLAAAATYLAAAGVGRLHTDFAAAPVNSACRIETWPDDTSWSERWALARTSGVKLVSGCVEELIPTCLAEDSEDSNDASSVFWGFDPGAVAVESVRGTGRVCRGCLIERARIGESADGLTEIRAFWAGTQLAMLAIAVLAGFSEPPVGTLWRFDARTNEIVEERMQRRSCGHSA